MFLVRTRDFPWLTTIMLHRLYSNTLAHGFRIPRLRYSIGPSIIRSPCADIAFGQLPESVVLSSDGKRRDCIAHKPGMNAATRSAVACHSACCACRSGPGLAGTSCRALLTEK